MIGRLLLSASVVIGLSASAQAAMAAPPAGEGAVRIAEGCGPGFSLGPAGYCHPFAVGRVGPVG
jgi:hypothetical protein